MRSEMRRISSIMTRNVARGASSGVSGARLFREHVFGACPDHDFQDIGVIWVIVGADSAPIAIQKCRSARCFSRRSAKP